MMDRGKVGLGLAGCGAGRGKSLARVVWLVLLLAMAVTAQGAPLEGTQNPGEEKVCGCGTPDKVWPNGTPFVASTPRVIDKMLEMARVKSGDLVYDIGSGDGAIVIRAAKRYGVRGVGIEIDPDLVRRARENALREKVDHLVDFRTQDAFDADISPATVVTLYMLPDFTAKFRGVMERQLKPGTRVVSNHYPIPGWVPDREEGHTESNGVRHQVMLFEMR